jgi:hypothetical protein
MNIALCVGINYENTDHALRGCLNDCIHWDNIFRRNGYKSVRLEESRATKNNIVANLEAMVSSLRSGDRAFFTFSGHGTWVPDTDGDESDGRDEALCPFDVTDSIDSLILDDDLAQIYNKVPDGALLTVINDCCHSGTVSRLIAAKATGRTIRSRSLPVENCTWLRDRSMSSVVELMKKPTKSIKHANIVSLSACQDNQVAADAYLPKSTVSYEFCGAFSHYLQEILTAIPTVNTFTFSALYKAVRKSLPNQDFSQIPQMTISRRNRDAKVFG